MTNYNRINVNRHYGVSETFSNLHSEHSDSVKHKLISTQKGALLAGDV